MENQFYQMYMDELSEIPECTNEEMESLLNSLPNEEAVKRLTEGSLAYVVREAAKYAGNDVEISDLVQEGNMALLLVLKNYASHPVVGDDAVSYFNQLRERAHCVLWKGTLPQTVTVQGGFHSSTCTGNTLRISWCRKLLQKCNPLLPLSQRRCFPEKKHDLPDTDFLFL